MSTVVPYLLFVVNHYGVITLLIMIEHTMHLRKQTNKQIKGQVCEFYISCTVYTFMYDFYYIFLEWTAEVLGLYQCS